jgi:hypothetical protein
LMVVGKPLRRAVPRLGFDTVAAATHVSRSLATRRRIFRAEPEDNDSVLDQYERK